MPELPEVETVRLGLVSLIVGKSITKITHDWAKSFPNPETEVSKFAIGAKIIDVRRRAKVLMIDLSTGYTFVIHLKMTGQLVFVGQRKTLKSKSEILKNNKEKVLIIKFKFHCFENVPFGSYSIQQNNPLQVQYDRFFMTDNESYTYVYRSDGYPVSGTLLSVSGLAGYNKVQYIYRTL